MITSKQIKENWAEDSGCFQNPDTKLWLKIGDGVKIGNRG